MARIFYLVGPPAVGKLTVARRIAARTGAVVVDNHLVGDPVFVPMDLARSGRDLTSTDSLRERVLAIVHEAAEMAPADTDHVFTNWLAEGSKGERAVADLRALAGRREAQFVPVWLQAVPETLRRRVVGADRQVSAKVSDPSLLMQILASPPLAAPADALIVQTDGLNADDVASKVLRSCT
ncbi:AAA family ATPase [Dermacoccaceae bacterium W4C1]